MWDVPLPPWAEKSPDWEGSERKCGLPDSQIWDGFGRGDRQRYFQSPFPPPPPPPPRRTIRPSSASPSLCMVLRKGASSPSLFFCVSYEFFRKDAWNLGICSDFGAGSHAWAVSKTRSYSPPPVFGLRSHVFLSSAFGLRYSVFGLMSFCLRPSVLGIRS